MFLKKFIVMSFSSHYTNLILLFLASIAVALLIRYTDIVNIGFCGYLEGGVTGVKRIFYGQAPSSDLSPAEKEKTREETAKDQNREPLFCGSSFFPWLPGASWQYRLFNGSKQDLISLGIPTSQDNKYFLDGQLESNKRWTIRSLFRCDRGKIWLTDLSFWEIYALDRTVTTPCGAEEYNFSLPQDKDFSGGNTWTEKGCLKHEVLDRDYDKIESEWEETVETRWRALGTENVKVPAGEFSAEKMEVTLTREQKFSAGPQKILALIRLWVAKEVGIVKISYQELGADQKPTNKETIFQELTGFQIPTERNFKK